jgi:hypothetical protein
MKVNKPQSLKPQMLGHDGTQTPRGCIDLPLKVLKGTQVHPLGDRVLSFN